MAKMFYTVEETAERLGVNADQVRDMAAGGKLQQFRDRDKLMFKRDQVDALASLNKSGTGSDTSIPLASSGDTDAIGLADSSADSRGPGGPPRKEDPRQATGVSVFDQDEVEHADPMAQTQVTTPVADQEQLALESVGSGSGLLDLTRESDDTSLGAELLDEIYPGGTEAGSGATKEASVPGSSGVFEGALQAESGASGLENLSQQQAPDTLVTVSSGPAEVYDPAGDWMSGLALAGATIVLFVGLIVAFAAVLGAPSGLANAIGKSGGTLAMYAGIMLAVVLILALAGFFIGRSQER
jgi:excisionase family DNA binding protein